MPTITAVELAKRAGIDPQKFRKALRKHSQDSDLSWHHRSDPWKSEMGSDRHRAMERVLAEVLKGQTSKFGDSGVALGNKSG
jgi:3-hydroxyisobutyrate dehydrogenase-like beta-hydroxyacid dehydrogenase